jgi:hypothetical protein
MFASSAALSPAANPNPFGYSFPPNFVGYGDPLFLQLPLQAINNITPRLMDTNWTTYQTLTAPPPPVVEEVQYRTGSAIFS